MSLNDLTRREIAERYRVIEAQNTILAIELRKALEETEVARAYNHTLANALTTIRRNYGTYHVEQIAAAALEEAVIKEQAAIIDFPHDYAEWSFTTFGTGKDTPALLSHIRKELREIEADPSDLVEWVDLILLGINGFLRHGGFPSELYRKILAKHAINKKRVWRAPKPGLPTEHVREGV